MTTARRVNATTTDSACGRSRARRTPAVPRTRSSGCSRATSVVNARPRRDPRWPATERPRPRAGHERVLSPSPAVALRRDPAPIVAADRARRIRRDPARRARHRARWHPPARRRGAPRDAHRGDGHRRPRRPGRRASRLRRGDDPQALLVARRLPRPLRRGDRRRRPRRLRARDRSAPRLRVAARARDLPLD